MYSGYPIFSAMASAYTQSIDTSSTHTRCTKIGEPHASLSCNSETSLAIWKTFRTSCEKQFAKLLLTCTAVPHAKQVGTRPDGRYRTRRDGRTDARDATLNAALWEEAALRVAPGPSVRPMPPLFSK